MTMRDALMEVLRREGKSEAATLAAAKIADKAMLGHPGGSMVDYQIHLKPGESIEDLIVGMRAELNKMSPEERVTLIQLPQKAAKLN